MQFMITTLLYQDPVPCFREWLEIFMFLETKMVLELIPFSKMESQEVQVLRCKGVVIAFLFQILSTMQYGF